jgi:preprotein translocase subunit SecY
MLVTTQAKYSLMDMGMSAIYQTSLAIQGLSFVGLIHRKYGEQDNSNLHDAFGKLVTLVITAGHALFNIFTGEYCPWNQMGVFTAFILFVQLMFSGVLVNLFDDVLEGGYGLGNGSNIFIALNVCSSIVKQLLSFHTNKFGRGRRWMGR